MTEQGHNIMKHIFSVIQLNIANPPIFLKPHTSVINVMLSFLFAVLKNISAQVYPHLVILDTVGFYAGTYFCSQNLQLKHQKHFQFSKQSLKERLCY